MSVFHKVLEAIQNRPLNGHALANQQNKISLAIAKMEIEKMMEKIT